MLRRIFCLLPALALAACGSGETGSTTDVESGMIAGATPALDAVSAEGPEGTYARVCGYCHGANVGPVILGRSLPADAISAIVRSGRNAMPAFRPSEISDADLQALARWIEESEQNPEEHGG